MFAVIIQLCLHHPISDHTAHLSLPSYLYTRIPPYPFMTAAAAQVDVVDSEFCTLQEEIESAGEFQSVLRAHRNFIASVTRLSSVDNLTVQEAIERVLQVCLRFIAICRLLHQQEDHEVSRGWSADPLQSPDPLLSPSSRHDDSGADPESTGNNDGTNNIASPGSPSDDLTNSRRRRQLPVIIPPEEIDGVRKEFFTQISYLFQVMRKVENRGFMFRLDFNGYLSELANDIGAGLDR
jgi:Gamma tubulin complex component C-terminal